MTEATLAHDAHVQLHAALQRQAAQHTLLSAVALRPWEHDFFALLRRLDALRPDQPRTGHALRPQQEALRFAQPPEMDFAPAPLSRLEFREARGLAPRLSVRFFGLLGPQGALPLHLTEFVRERLHKLVPDAGPAHFLDLFHHRLLALFYRAWAQAQPVVQADRPGDDRFLAWLLSLAGQVQAPSANALPARALAHHAGLLAGRTRHPEALCKVLQQQLGVLVRLLPHVGQWMAISQPDRSRLGFAANRRERALAPRAELGRLLPAHGPVKTRQYEFQAYAGSRVWDRQHRFRLQLGPLSLAQYQHFLPDGAGWAVLLAWVRQLAGLSFCWDVELVLAPAERPAPLLGSRPLPDKLPDPAAKAHPDTLQAQRLGTRLGISTWLGTGAAPKRTPRQPLQHLQLRPHTTFLQRHPGA